METKTHTQMKTKKKNSNDFERVFTNEFNSQSQNYETDKYKKLYFTLCYCKGYFNSDDSQISKVLTTIINSIQFK